MSSPWDVIFEGSPDDVRAYLEERLGTEDFRVNPQGSFMIRLPLLGDDRKPRSTGETLLVEVRPVSEWSIEAPARGGLWHAIPIGDAQALCTIDTNHWKGERQRDDTHEVTCPWCRVRLIAIEIVAPPGPRRILAWHELCVYTMRHSSELAQWESMEEGEATEHRPWRRGSEIFLNARSEGTIVPVLFSAADANSGLIYYGRLQDLEVNDETTTFRVSAVRQLARAYPLSSLVLESTGEPLSDSYIRPYAICHAPSWLPPPDQPVAGAAAAQPSTRSVAARGISLVIEEVRRRGGTAVHDPAPGARNRLTVRNSEGREFTGYVKTRRVGDWQTDTRKGEPRSPIEDETSLWILVDLTTEPVDFYVTPEWWIQNNIYEVHTDYLATHGGRRAQTPDSTHHRITTDRVVEWRGRWDLMGLGDTLSVKPTLHEEIQRVLRQSEDEWMSTAEIAAEVNAARRYRKRDDSEVTPFQIHGRTMNYPQLFERDGSRVRLRTGDSV